MFLSRDEVLSHPELQGSKRFVVIRDLRDTLVSYYFSVKISHVTTGQIGDDERLLRLRRALTGMSEEEGFLYLIGMPFRGAIIQQSWVNQGETLWRYENMLLDPVQSFRKLFLEHLRLGISRRLIDSAVGRTHFQTVYGRALGEEDTSSHGRQALPGDWRNHFTPSVRRAFADKYADLLISTGYEKDNRWVTEA